MNAKQRWFGSAGMVLAATLLIAGLFGSGTGGFDAHPVSAHNDQITCPVGFTPTLSGCVPIGAIGGCPAGFIATTGGCLPVGAAGLCPTGYILIGTSCTPT